MYLKYLLIVVQDLNGKRKQDLQLVILTKFVLCIFEEQQKNYMSYKHSIKCSEIRFMHKKGPKYVTASVFLLEIDLFAKCYLICWHPCVFLLLKKETIK